MKEHKIRPKLLSTGQIEVDGVQYRLREDPELEEFEIVREFDGVVIGRFGFDRADELGTVHLDGAPLEPELAQAIAEMLVTPRGSVPLQ